MMLPYLVAPPSPQEMSDADEIQETEWAATHERVDWNHLGESNVYFPIPEGPRGRDFVEEEDAPSVEPYEAPPDSPRWHFDHEGRRFILYASTIEEERAQAGRFLDRQGVGELAGRLVANGLVASGHYSRKTNTIVDPQDGPTTFLDCRKSGGGSRG